MSVAAAAALWDFAVRTYAAPGAAATCLDLQDRRGVDVCLLLTGLWCGRTGRGPAPATIERCREVSAFWSVEVIGPLRAARRAMRPLVAAHHHRAEALGETRTRLAELELSLERAELAELAGLVDRLTTAGRPSPRLAARLARRLTGIGAEERQRLGHLLRATFATPEQEHR